MKILFIDIETAPILANVWGLFNQNVGLSQIISDPYILCWAAKWKGEDEVYYDSLPRHNSYKDDSENDYHVVESAWAMLDEADIVIGHNARKFDIKWLNGRFLVHGLRPPSPYKIVDTLSVARGRFRLASNRLDYIAGILGRGHKLKTDFDLWKGCIRGDKKHWKNMVDYNIQDVVLLEEIYNDMLPWIHNHPAVSHGLSCRNCGSESLQSRGQRRTNAGWYKRFQCNDCGAWNSGSQLIKDNSLRPIPV